jgi:hypothetical protein
MYMLIVVDFAVKFGINRFVSLRKLLSIQL